MIAGEGSDAKSSPAPAVRVAVTHRLRRSPQRSTAAAFHRVPAGNVTFYGRLTVHHPELRTPLMFCLRDRHHGALVSHHRIRHEGSLPAISLLLWASAQMTGSWHSFSSAWPLWLLAVINWFPSSV